MNWSSIINIGLFQNTLRTATPVILAGLGCLMTDHVGIMNIGIDGMMVIGAFSAVIGSYFLGSWVYGLLFALVSGILLGLFYALFSVTFKSDEFIIGVALNIFANGVTVFLLRTIFGVKGAFSDPRIVPIPKLVFPWLEKIPVVGPLLNGNTLLVYFSWIMVFLCWVLIYKTPAGFWLRASGEHPESLRSAGMNPNRMKYLASVLCGGFSALAGAHLSLGYLTMFSENMSASRGYVAVACVIFGHSNPPLVFLAALLFGFIDAMGTRLQSVGVDPTLTKIFPYAGTILMMVLLVLRQQAKKKKAARISAEP